MSLRPPSLCPPSAPSASARAARARAAWAHATFPRAALACVLGARAAAAQPAAQPAVAPAARPPAVGAWAVAPFVGYATRSPERFWGLTPGRNHLMLGAQFVRAVWRGGPVAVAYAPNVVPVFVLSNNPYADSPPVGGADTARLACEARRCGPVLGAAVAPAGVRVDLRVRPGVELFGAAAAGLALFARNVPVVEARRLNVTAEWGGGVVVGRGRAAVQLGYKYHHLSNAYTADRNPGVDGRVVYAGVMWRARGAAR